MIVVGFQIFQLIFYGVALDLFFLHCLKFYTNHQRDESALKKDDMDLSMLLLPLCLDAMLVLLHEMSAFGAVSKQHFKIFDTFDATTFQNLRYICHFSGIHQTRRIH